MCVSFRPHRWGPSARWWRLAKNYFALGPHGTLAQVEERVPFARNDSAARIPQNNLGKRGCGARLVPHSKESILSAPRTRQQVEEVRTRRSNTRTGVCNFARLNTLSQSFGRGRDGDEGQEVQPTFDEECLKTLPAMPNTDQMVRTVPKGTLPGHVQTYGTTLNMRISHCF